VVNAGERGPDVIARDGDLVIRRMHDTPADYAVIARWLTDTAVLMYYDGRDNPSPLPRVIAEFGPYVRGETNVVPCIVEYAGVPIGYLQYYVLDADERAAFDLPDLPDLFGMDVFIGEPSYWDRGLGTRLVAATLRYLFEQAGARQVLIDPQTWNARAVRVWEKCGFRKVRLLPAHELHEGVYRDCWLMAADPPGG
jgi:aminoglycoside 6'-N-acetyltransferase